MLKQINKDNLLKANGIDANKYNSDRVYKMIKKNKLAYNSLNKETILTLILNFERNSKANRAEALLSKKTHRKKSRAKENLSSEKISKRYAQLPEEAKFEEGYLQQERGYATGRVRKGGKREDVIAPSSIYATNINTRSRRFGSRNENIGNMRGSGNINNIQYAHSSRTTQSKLTPRIYLILLARSRRSVKRRHMQDDFIYGNDEDVEEYIKDVRDIRDSRAYAQFPSRNQFGQFSNYPNAQGSAIENVLPEENGKELVNRNLNIIINKSKLFKNYVKEEEERLSSGKDSAQKSTKQEFSYSNMNSNKIGIKFKFMILLFFSFFTIR